MLRRTFITATLGIILLISTGANADNPRVMIVTNLGSMTLELYPNEAPQTVTNFLNYVESGFYNGTIFHRVIDNFMIQGGGIDQQMRRKSTLDPIRNEADNGLQNRIGTIAMARTNDPHSATSQFFINVANNSSLDFREKTPRAWGYTVFGRVVDGMRTVNQIRTQPTTSRNGYQDVPVTPVIIESIRKI